MKRKLQKTRAAFGIDLGGTKVAIGLIDQNGHIISSRTSRIVDIKSQKPPKKAQTHLISIMGDLIEDILANDPELRSRYNIQGVGLASAGPLNVTRGELVHPVNFPGWKIVPIQSLFAEHLKKRGLKFSVYFQNDAMAAALAEGWIGGAKELESYAVVTIGTGIGTGVIFQGQPVQTHGMGSEFGHLLVRENNVKAPEDLALNTVEGLASGTGILQHARAQGFQGHTMEELVDHLSRRPDLTGLFDVAADALGALCFNLSIGFHLEKILFSGGMMSLSHLFWKRMQNRYKVLIQTWNPSFTCPLTVARAGRHAGMIGAAYLPFRDRA